MVYKQVVAKFKKNIYVTACNISNTFFSIIFTHVDDFTLNSDNNKEIWNFGWPLLAFLAFVTLDESLKQKLAFADKN